MYEEEIKAEDSYIMKWGEIYHIDVICTTKENGYSFTTYTVFDSQWRKFYVPEQMLRHGIREKV